VQALAVTAASASARRPRTRTGSSVKARQRPGSSPSGSLVVALRCQPDLPERSAEPSSRSKPLRLNSRPSRIEGFGPFRPGLAPYG